jgi:hypothetical protein
VRTVAVLWLALFLLSFFPVLMFWSYVAMLARDAARRKRPR